MSIPVSFASFSQEVFWKQELKIHSDVKIVFLKIFNDFFPIRNVAEK